MANKIPDLSMISKMETQCKGNLASAICLSAVPPGRGVCSAACEPYLLPAGTWRA